MSILTKPSKWMPTISPRGLAKLTALLGPPMMIGFLVYNHYSLIAVLAGLLAIGVVALIADKPEATTAIVLFIVYANIPVVLKKTYGLPDLVAGSFFLLLFVPLLHYLVIRQQPVVTNEILSVMVAYLAALLISATFSGQAQQSVDRVLSYVLEGLILYILILNTIRTPALLHQAIWALILAGVLMGSISLYQEAKGDYENSFGGMSVVNDSVINTGQVTTFGKEIKRPRLAGPLGEKNRYAQVMVVLLPLALFRIWSERRMVLRVAAAASCIPIIGGALLTFSRGAGIAIVITLLAMAVLRTIKLWQLLVLCIVGYAFISLAVPDYLYRLSTTSDVAVLASGNASEAGGSVRGRATENLAAVHIFLDHPFLGVGPGQTSRYTTEYGNAVGFRRLAGERRAHNMYLEELSDTGIIGFTLFMSIIGMTLYQLIELRRKWLKRQPEVAYTAASFIVAIIAYLLTAIFLHLSYVRYYWLLLALAAAAIRVLNTTEATQASPAFAHTRKAVTP